MEIYKQLMYIFLFSLIGELISKNFNLIIPGSVIGMLLLFIFLELKFLKLEKIEKVSNFLTNNLGILFVPAGVGIMTKFGLIKNIWASFFALAVLTTAISLVIIAKIVDFMINKKDL